MENNPLTPTPPRAVFESNAAYTIQELEAMLSPAVSVKVFLESLGVARRFKYLVLGADILRALENPPEHSDFRANPPQPAPVVFSLTNQAGKTDAPTRRPRGRPRKDGTPPRRRLTLADVTPLDRSHEYGR